MFSFLWLLVTLPLHAHSPAIPAHFEDHGLQAVARGFGAPVVLRAAESRFGPNRMVIEGADARVAPRGVEPLPGRTHYLRGKDSARWRTGLRQYGRVRFPEIYPGIDVLYYSNGEHLEHDWIVAPGADPSAIRLRFPGAQPRVDASGDLIVSASLRLRKPRVYQAIDGVEHTVAARYVRRTGAIGFEIGDYDRTRALTIDPVIAYSSFLGGTSDDGVYAAAVDASGNVYLTGSAMSSDFPVTKGSLQNRIGVGQDAFVVKLGPDGKTILYATYLGGNDDDVGTAITTRPDGTAYVTGYTYSDDFPTSAGAYLSSLESTSWSAFVTALAPGGDKLVYSTYFAGTTEEVASTIAVDASGAAYIAGSAHSSDLPALNAYSGGGDAFVAKIDPSGSKVLYSRYLGGTQSDEAVALVLDAGGGVTLTGNTFSPDFPLLNAFQDRHNGVPAFRTTNSGNDWSPAATGLPRAGVWALAIEPTAPTKIYAGTDAGLFRSSDGGLTWSDANNGIAASVIYSILIDKTAPANVYAAGSAGVFKSSDSGATWTAANRGFAAARAYAVAADPSASTTLYAGTRAGLYKSTDGAGTWTAINNCTCRQRLATLSFYSVAADPNTPGTVFAGGLNGLLLKSTDGGATWASSNRGIDSTATINGIAFDAAPRTLLIATDAGVYRSTDGGQTWVGANSGLTSTSVLNIVYGAAPSVAYAVTSGAGIFQTTNTGGRWVPINHGMTGLYARTVAVDPTAPSTLIAGSSLGPDAFIVKLDAAGNLAYSTYFGGNGPDSVSALAVDVSGRITIYGSTQSSNWPVTGDPVQSSLEGVSNLFLTRLDPVGGALLFSTYIGGSGTDSAGGMVIDANGLIHLGANTNSPDMTVTSDAAQTQLAGDYDAYYIRLDPEASTVLFATYLGGSRYESEPALAIDTSGNLWLAGYTASADWKVTPDAAQKSFSGDNNGYVVRIPSP